MSVNLSPKDKASHLVYISLIPNSHLPLLSSTKKLCGKKVMERKDHYHIELRLYAIMLEILPSLFFMLYAHHCEIK